jgi:predicted trehalose synthase
MHLALERAFGQTMVDAAEWVDQMEATVAAANPSLLDGEGVAAAVAAIRASGLRTPALRTHGDFHLGRTARTDLGWVVADLTPGGRPLGADRPVFRSPLADVADMLWSIHHVSTVANAERDPTGREGTTVLSRSWAARNRHTFLTAYLAAPGIAGVAPSDRTLVRHLVTVFELERAASPMAHPA